MHPPELDAMEEVPTWRVLGLAADADGCGLRYVPAPAPAPAPPPPARPLDWSRTEEGMTVVCEDDRRKGNEGPATPSSCPVRRGY